MAGKRSFSDENIPVKADDYHGLAGYVRTQPDIASQGVKSVNIEMTFEEALRLSLAIQSCLLQLNRYKRSATEGREMGMLLSIKTDSNTITVIEKRVKPAEESQGT
jgi:hypothetical protein